ncbi:hypothetical protein NLI96_g9473 [Meripilus lineatus]|uniref:Uncharacterized protein n=1 Tax=Meripilus lineatus TaxID=2056292 RepID=A0AAD5YF92_9APHY|nr:hypothetical protein NLI96_g9473 [Physisporinus lineatus]
MVNSPLVSTTSTVTMCSAKSPTHSCFDSLDITALIVDLLDEGPKDLGRRNLANFARTCRATVDPALRLLWKDQTGLDNLIRTLPADAWSEEVEDTESESESGDPSPSYSDSQWRWLRPPRPMPTQKVKVLSLQRLLGSSEWKRFDYYAALIKVLRIKDTTMSDRVPLEWSQSVLTSLHLHQSFIRRDLLPNLREFKYVRADKSQCAFPQIPLLLTRSLKVVDVEISVNNNPGQPKDIEWIQSFTSYLPNASPEMEHIRLSACNANWGYGSSEVVIDIQPLTSFSHLRSFICELQVGKLATAVQLAQLPKLEELSLDFDPRHFPHRAPPEDFPHPFIFPRLKSLACTLSPQFLQACRFPALQSFTIKHLDGLRDSLNALREHCTPGLMREVTIDCPETLNRLSFPEDMQGLLDLPALERVTIQGYGWGLGDQALETIALAWPNLRSLDLRDNYRSKPTTLLGLVPLVKHCPDLVSLSVSISFRQPSIAPTDLAGIRCSNPHLDYLHFQDSIINELECDPVASLLSRLFPNLRRIRLYEWGLIGEPPKGIEKWSRVEGLLKGFAGAGAQE